MKNILVANIKNYINISQNIPKEKALLEIKGIIFKLKKAYFSRRA